MTLPFLIHSLFLITAVILTFFWTSNPSLSLYTLQLIGFFILLYFINKGLQKKSLSRYPKNYPPPVAVNNSVVSSVVFTMVVLLLVMSTGGLTSPLFFLIYFLLFGLSLTLDPNVTIIFSIVLSIFFSLTSPITNLSNLLPLFSLVLITPLSLFFGKQYLDVLNQKGVIKILKIKEQKEKRALKEEETNSLMWLSLNFFNNMTGLIDQIGYVLERGGLSYIQKQYLNKAMQNAKNLLLSGKELKKKIDEQTDEN